MISISDKNHRGKYNNAKTGTYLPKHPEKYTGTYPIIYKSMLERLFMRWADESESVVSWGYENYHIKYLDESSYPAKIRRYFIDFICKVKIGSIYKTIWVEIKPKCETIKPRSNCNPKTMLTWIKNSCKWKAARLLAAQKGYEFKVLTEEQLT